MGEFLDFAYERLRNGHYSVGNFVPNPYTFGKNYICIDRIPQRERLHLCGDFYDSAHDYDCQLFDWLRTLKL